MKTDITVIGTRGIPEVLGGVESHCQNLYPLIVSESDKKVCVIARSPYVDYKESEYKGVMLKSVFAPKKKSLEAICHSTLAAFTTLFDGSKIVHVHAIGPGLVVPLLRLMGKKVVFTHHGPDYDRQKWGGTAKKVLMLGEKLAVNYASEVIVISDVINNLIKKKYNRQDAHLIYNGVQSAPTFNAENSVEILSEWQLKPQNYVVAVGRWVEEKGFHDLIMAYKKSNISLPLVLIGAADHASAYSDKLQQMAEETPNVICTGFLQGERLQTVFSQAKCFAMPSYHEGLPIALLEAMSYSLPVILSDIPANAEVALSPEVYFPVGNIEALAEQLNYRANSDRVDYTTELTKYHWPSIAKQTLAVYQKALTCK
jgi:glycosyltransferase involved in cell wall biosynthesis